MNKHMKSVKVCLQVVTAILLAIVLTSCAGGIFKKGKLAMQEIHQVLADSTVANEKTIEKVQRSFPSEFENALLPELSLVHISSSDSKKRFDVFVKDVPADNFFLALVKGTPYNIVVSPKVTGQITLSLQNVTMEDVLEAVHDLYGYHYHKTTYGFKIEPAGIQTRVFTVNYLDVQRSGGSSTSISSGQLTSSGESASGDSGSQASTIQTNFEADFWKSLHQSLDIIVDKSKDHKIVINPDAGLVIVKADPATLKQVADYLDSLQEIMTRQVIIEAKVIEVTLDKQYQAGIDWKILGLQQTGNSITASPSQVLPDKLGAFSSIFTLTGHGGKDFSALMKLLSSQGNVQVLSSPRIATLNNQKAVIKVGTDEFFVTNVSSTTASSGSSSSDATQTQDVELTPFFSGIALGVTPQISANGDVTLHIHPIVSEVIGKSKSFTVSGKDDSVPLAVSSIRESDSVVHAKNGQVIVIGGLMQNNSTEQLGSVPGIGDIPVAGAAFRRTEQHGKKSELVILIQPIVANNKVWAREVKTLQERYKGMDAGFHIGGQPSRFGTMGEKQLADAWKQNFETEKTTPKTKSQQAGGTK